MTALGKKCAEVGWYPSETVADAAITAGDVYKDANGDIRANGRSGKITEGAITRTQVDASSLTKHSVPPPKQKF